MPQKSPLEEAQDRLAEALNRYERLEADPRASHYLLRAANISCGYWRRQVRLLAKEPQQRALALELGRRRP